jgi:hypothetical protein
MQTGVTVSSVSKLLKEAMEGLSNDLLQSVAQALAETSSIRPFAAVSITVRSAMSNNTLRLLERGGVERFVARLRGPHARANVDVLPLDRRFFYAVHGLEAYHMTVIFEADGVFAPAWQGTVAQLFDSEMRLFVPQWQGIGWNPSLWVTRMQAGLDRIFDEDDEEVVNGIATGIRLGVYVQCGPNGPQIRLCEPGLNWNRLPNMHADGRISFGQTMNTQDEFENTMVLPDELPATHPPTNHYHAFRIFPSLTIASGEVHLQFCKTVPGPLDEIVDGEPQWDLIDQADMTREEMLLFFDVLNHGLASL